MLSGNKERGFKLLTFCHGSFVSFLILISIFMAKAARTLLAAHEAVFVLYRANMSGASLTAD